MGSAPKPKVETGEPVALRTRGLTAGATYIVKIKRVGGSYATLGSVIANSAGAGRLPVFEVGRTGTYVLAITNVQTGATVYQKVVAR
jgi:hypothetical protein